MFLSHLIDFGLVVFDDCFINDLALLESNNVLVQLVVDLDGLTKLGLCDSDLNCLSLHFVVQAVVRPQYPREGNGGKESSPELPRVEALPRDHLTAKAEKTSQN